MSALIMDNTSTMNRKRANADGNTLTAQNAHKRRSSTAAEPDNLCDRCSKVKINLLWSSTGEKQPLGPVSEWSTQTCALCNFLADLLKPVVKQSTAANSYQEKEAESSERTSSSEYYLYARHTREATSMRLLQIITPRILVLSDSPHALPHGETPYIAVHPTEEPYWLKTIQPRIDFSQPKEWLNICDQLHGDHCRRGVHSVTSDLSLIDCNTGDVISANDGDVYVALSYVWGHQGTSTRTSKDLPQTIRDAMTVTLNLGFKYLWVDKYCIEQENEVEFHKQLQQMGSIYQRATVTLVAASGAHADSGLPGVSLRTRTAPKSITVGQNKLSAVLKIPDLLSEKYRWSSRAWTFQEGLLSTRRLVFTDEQLYFECQGYYCVETLDIPLQAWKKAHHHEEQYIHPRYRVAPNLGVFPLDGCGVDPWDIYSRIDEYTKRALTDPSDILKGMLGIFRAFEHSKNSMRHLYGMPFPRMAKMSPNKMISETGSKRVLPMFSESLRWNLEEPSERRNGFPSWSWTGWFGNVKWPVEYTGNHRKRGKPRRVDRPRDHKANEDAIAISIDRIDQPEISWNEYQDRYEEFNVTDQLSGVIHLEANVSTIEYAPGEQDEDGDLRLICENRQYVTPRVSWTMHCNAASAGALLAIHFLRTASRNSTSDAFPRSVEVLRQHILIVRDHNTHWERVALGVYEIEPGFYVNCTRQRLRLG